MVGFVDGHQEIDRSSLTVPETPEKSQHTNNYRRLDGYEENKWGSPTVPDTPE
jgi:hypothetical protein